MTDTPIYRAVIPVTAGDIIRYDDRVVVVGERREDHPNRINVLREGRATHIDVDTVADLASHADRIVIDKRGVRGG